MRSAAFVSGITAVLVAFANAYTTPVTFNVASNPIYRPQAGDMVPAGASYGIAWQPTSPGTVTLVLLSGPTTNLQVVSVITEAVSNSGFYSWTPSSDLPPLPATGDHYGIQIIDDATGDYQWSPAFGLTNNAVASSSAASSVASSSAATSSAASSASVSSASSYPSSAYVYSTGTGYAGSTGVIVPESAMTSAAATAVASAPAGTVGDEVVSTVTSDGKVYAVHVATVTGENCACTESGAPVVPVSVGTSIPLSAPTGVYGWNSTGLLPTYSQGSAGSTGLPVPPTIGLGDSDAGHASSTGSLAVQSAVPTGEMFTGAASKAGVSGLMAIAAGAIAFALF